MMGKNNGKAIHLDRLQPCPANVVGLAGEANRCLEELQESYRRIKGLDLLLPPELSREIPRFFNMLDRFVLGDYRCKRSEIKAMEITMKWVYEENCRLRNQTIDKIDN